MKSQASVGMRIALLGSFTVELLAKYVTAAFGKQGLKPELYVGGYSRYHQDLLDFNSSYYGHDPQYTLLVLDGLDVFPAFFFEPSSLSRTDKAALVRDRLEEFRQLSDVCCSRLPSSQLIITQIVFPSRTISTKNTMAPTSPNHPC